jgi:VIT1/CCC1 family predicted Fe2+/Mn2+ transporter
MQNNHPGSVTQKAMGTYATVLTIRTSEQGWLAQLAKAYRNRDQVVIIDDANVGIDPSSQTLLDMGLKTGLSRKEWTAVLIAGGMTIFGAAVIILAIVDPDPTSKLGLLIASGALLTLGGGFSAIGILTKHKPPNVRMSRDGIEIEWN